MPAVSSARSAASWPLGNKAEVSRGRTAESNLRVSSNSSFGTRVETAVRASCPPDRGTSRVSAAST